MKFLLPLFLFAFTCLNAEAIIWHVGAAQTYTMPSQVSTLVQDGDTVDIDAGVYAMDVAKWTANDLVIRGVGGMAQLTSGGLVYGGKAIWVIAGDNALVEYIEFSEATCPDQNGAGIRQEGHNLTVRHCKFFDNQMGILAGTLNPSHILVEYTEFANNGAGDGYSHNIYVNNIDTFTFRYNYTHDAWVGHDLKSRAHINFILYNRISDEAGDASRNIDLPNGGTSYIIGNVIEQGPLSQNQDVIGYGLEGLTNPTPHELYAVNNTIVNNRTNAIYFHLAPAMASFKAYNNILAGPAANPYTGLPAMTDTVANVFLPDTALFHFVDPLNYDYRLTDSSLMVLNNGVDPGNANGFSLQPLMEYIHPVNVAARCAAGLIDIGAYELCDIGTFVQHIEEQPMFYPNPNDGIIHFATVRNNITITNAMGAIVLKANDVSRIDVRDLTNGIYFLKADNVMQTICIQK